MIVPKNKGVRWIAAIANQESLLLDFGLVIAQFPKKGAGLSFSATVATFKGGLKSHSFGYEHLAEM